MGVRLWFVPTEGCTLRLTATPATSMQAPTEAELAQQAGGLKKTETKAGGGDFDETPYKTAWDAAGGDAAKVQTDLNLKAAPKDYDDYIKMCKAGQFND